MCELSMAPYSGQKDRVTVTLWGSWAETGEYLDAGMDLAVFDPEKTQYQGKTQWTTGEDTMVVVEPDFLVDVTDVRSWVQCPRMYYLNKLSGTPLAYPVVKGTIVHEIFGDLLRGRNVERAVSERVSEVGLELGLLGRDAKSVREDVRDHARAIEGWLEQGKLSNGGQTTFGPDSNEWRSERTLISQRYGIKGRADAVRRGMPVELKTGKNTRREPRFQDKIQAVAYALILGEKESDPPDTGTLLYTKNAALDRNEESGNLSPAKEFSIGSGLLEFVLRTRNEIAAMEHDMSVPTGQEADAKCEYCFEQDTCMAVSGRLDQESKAGQVGSPIPDEEREYFQAQYRAIEAERRVAHREYAKLWRQDPEERAEDDRALIDLEPTGKRELDGGRWELRAKATGGTSKIREGDVVLASDGDPIEGNAELARLQRIDSEIVVTADEALDLRRLDIYPSELSADRMLTALHDALLRQSSEQKDILFERREPAFREIDRTIIENNPAQDRAIRRALGSEDFALIHGPPGSGKTYTLARLVRELAEKGESILLSAFTNRAVDNAVEALLAQGFSDIARIGTENGVRDDLQSVRLDPDGNPDERVTELKNRSVVAATTATCGSRIVRDREFDVAVVDEAGQLSEPNALAPISRADRFVLVGDHQQLPPVVRADSSEDVADLSESLFERLIDRYPEAGVMLDRQYRMAQRIQAFSSREFYDGQLRPASTAIAGQSLADLDEVDITGLPEKLADRVGFIDPGGQADGNTNPTEASTVAETVEAYLTAGVDATDLGVIAPYRAQVAAIGQKVPETVTVDTVDRFQGSSKEVIIVSFVATGNLDGPIFEDYRRINVALTRAKRALILIGEKSALKTDPVYGRMLEWAR